MKIINRLFLLIALTVGVSVSASASSCRLAENAIDQAFEQSDNITASLLVMKESQTDLAAQFMMAEDDAAAKKQRTAAIVGVVQLVTGIGILIPIHRFILGTDGKGFVIFLVYCGLGLIGGWSWWLTAADVVFMFMDDTKSKYVNNGKIIMFMDDF